MADHTFLDIYLEALEDSNSEGSTLDTYFQLASQICTRMKVEELHRQVNQLTDSMTLRMKEVEDEGQKIQRAYIEAKGKQKSCDANSDTKLIEILNFRTHLVEVAQQNLDKMNLLTSISNEIGKEMLSHDKLHVDIARAINPRIQIQQKQKMWLEKLNRLQQMVEKISSEMLSQRQSQLKMILVRTQQLIGKKESKQQQGKECQEEKGGKQKQSKVEEKQNQQKVENGDRDVEISQNDDEEEDEQKVDQKWEGDEEEYRQQQAQNAKLK